MKRRILAMVTILAASWPMWSEAAAPGAACTRAPFGIAGFFNLFALDRVDHHYGDVEGRLAAGTHLSLQHYHLGDKLAFQRGEPLDGGPSAAVVAGGTFHFNDGTIWNGKIAYCSRVPSLNRVGWTSTELQAERRPGVVPPAPVFPSLPRPESLSIEAERMMVRSCPGQARDAVDFRAAGENLGAISHQWAQLARNGQTIESQDGILLKGSSETLNVFQVSGSSLEALAQPGRRLTFEVPLSSTVLVNVTGCETRTTLKEVQECGLNVRNFGFFLNGLSPAQVVYNFPLVGRLVLSDIGVQGTILAPWANVAFERGLVEGSLFVTSFYGRNSQANYRPFAGCLPARSEKR